MSEDTRALGPASASSPPASLFGGSATLGGIDSQRLEAALKVVAYANRIDLLGILREPHALQDIHLRPGPANAGERPQRPISRQAVAHHLDQLVEAGLVRSALVKRHGGKPVHEFVVDQGQLYALVEEFRSVSTLGSKGPANLAETVALSTSRHQPWEPGPKLILVHGVYEGKAFPLLDRDAKGGRGWIVGRRSKSSVCLGYDPYVSLENSELLRTRDGFKVVDLRSARNGTFLNWERLPLGGEAPLSGGDVLGVGRSMLVFREK